MGSSDLVLLPWWEQRWGVFDNSSDYGKAMELGRKYRAAQRPKPAKKKTRKAAKKTQVAKGR